MSGKPADGGDSLELFAPAKVNLSLRILGRRPDGYHQLESLMLKLAFGDRLTLESAPESGVWLYCPGSDLPEDSDNLVYRAAARFYEAAGLVPFLKITLHKRIPVAAGLGGGSSDAAAVLRGLEQLHPAALTPATLAELARCLGADVPFFLQQAPAAWARGIGEILTPAPIPPGIVRLLLVNPGFAVSTGWVYESANFPLTKQADPFTLSGSLTAGEEGWGSLVNDLERVTVARYPLLAEIKAELLAGGADAALMAGSGPTVFAIFSQEEAAAACEAVMRNRYPLVYNTEPLSPAGIE
ncbi:MAG TPA: 4-(cytidine 5'-diphospho)-2-C-methyl-D-erythritol kinase [Desulfurivibrio alkaliphilus]|uniref:4-diphosphocytidyl-2-C-methyl-D-erythritol kinase n=1 Tax=Desulfurivibrio alkaliphilus TaxID=427923 RepID=A0A7C2XPD9_9BACT|nr:4-(cytidine 5'-diphospho)-2-C-methyl-D-erythritol kinase [Desulfurivibrio alkaliphilus]